MGGSGIDTRRGRMRDQLFLEERVWVTRKILNEDSVQLLDRLGVAGGDRAALVDFIRQTMAVLEGDRHAVPRRHRHVLRIPRRPRPEPLPPNPDRASNPIRRRSTNG